MSTILIRDGSVLGPAGWLTPGCVLIQDGRIAEVEAGEPSPDALTQAEQVISARHAAVLPGLTNGHTHLSQTFMRGLAVGRPLLSWLKELIWPLQRAISPEVMYLAALLGLVENLRCGATSVIDHHKITASPRHTDQVCAAAEEVGLRFTLARSWADQGAHAESPESILADLERLFSRWASSLVISVGNGPLVPWRCSPETLRRTHALARQYQAPTHIHVSETRDEVQMSIDATGLRPITWLDSLGILGPHSQIVHSVWVDNNEIQLMAERGALVVHCPVSNTVLGSGIAPLAAMRRAGIRFRLGTDGPASNDTQDIFETLKQALCLARAVTHDPTALSPRAALAMALDGRVLAAGAPADVIIVNLNHPRVVPVHDLDSALVLGTHGADVQTVIVGGRLLMHDRRVLVLDEAALLDECRAAAKHLRQTAGIA